MSCDISHTTNEKQSWRSLERVLIVNDVEVLGVTLRKDFWRCSGNCATSAAAIKSWWLIIRVFKVLSNHLIANSTDSLLISIYVLSRSLLNASRHSKRSACFLEGSADHEFMQCWNRCLFFSAFVQDTKDVESVFCMEWEGKIYSKDTSVCQKHAVEVEREKKKLNFMNFPWAEFALILLLNISLHLRHNNHHRLLFNVVRWWFMQLII